MVNSWELVDLDNPSLEHDYALAYLDVCIEATKSIINGAVIARFSHSRPIISLALHGCELFFKGAIHRKNGEKIISDDVGNPVDHAVLLLEKKYTELYPEKNYSVELPFSILAIGFGDRKEEVESKIDRILDQKHRYPTDRHGNNWIMPESFDLELFFSRMLSLRERITYLGKLIHD